MTKQIYFTEEELLDMLQGSEVSLLTPKEKVYCCLDPDERYKKAKPKILSKKDSDDLFNGKATPNELRSKYGLLPIKTSVIINGNDKASTQAVEYALNFGDIRYVLIVLSGECTYISTESYDMYFQEKHTITLRKESDVYRLAVGFNDRDTKYLTNNIQPKEVSIDELIYQVTVSERRNSKWKF